MTRISLVSTVQVCDVPRHLNQALNWAFDEGHWTLVLSGDGPAKDAMGRIDAAMDRLQTRCWSMDDMSEARPLILAYGELSRLLDACFDNPDARLVIE